MSVFSDIRYSDKLKHEGHDLIDDLVRMGVPRYKVYKRMAKVLRLSHQEAHFSAAGSIERLEQMVKMLRNYADHVSVHRTKNKLIRPILRPKKKKKQKKGFIEMSQPTRKERRKGITQVLPREQMIQALAELKLYKSVEHEGALRPAEELSPLQSVLQRIGVV